MIVDDHSQTDAEFLCAVALEMWMNGHLLMWAKTRLEEIADRLDSAAPNFSAATPTTTPCNEQCQPNGCGDCPLDAGNAEGAAP